MEIALGQQYLKNLTPKSRGLHLQPQQKEKLSIANNKSSYLKCRFISISDSETPYPLCLICNSKLLNDAMKLSKLIWHLQTKHLELNDKPFDFFERKKNATEKRLLRTALSPKTNAPKVSYLVSHRIVKANKPFTIEELILPVY